MTTTDTGAPGTAVHELRPQQPLWARERAALDDAARLAELWDTALRASYRLGYHTGHQRGLIAGRHEEATAWQAIVTGYSAVLTQPRREELARLRMPRNEPCSARMQRLHRAQCGGHGSLLGIRRRASSSRRGWVSTAE